MLVSRKRYERRRSVLRLGRSTLAALVATPLLAVLPARAADDDEAVGFERTPPRLSLVDGETSFWRPGAEEWTVAQVNTPLAAGDQLYTAADANLEIQIAPRAYVRAGEQTQLGLFALEPDYLQLRVTDGDVSLDLRSLTAGQTYEIDTPNAAFTVENTGYYRVTVDGQTSTFISRRGGRAVVTPASGPSAAVSASEQVVVTGADAPTVESYAAPDIDSWDRWNYARTDRQIDAVSARYVPSSVYGLADLDEYGDWRELPSYGAVWVPRHVPVAWAPYSTGRWIYDPFYGWSWVDTAIWGWAPFHYGRWVNVSGFWGWCPGPIVVRPYYAPALVAFFGVPGFSVGVSIGPPRFGWVALGWGEPLIPWWGPTHFRHRPYWAGWGGPHVVNRVVVHKHTVINVDKINVYENERVRHGVVVVDRGDFGRRRVDAERRHPFDADKLRPVHGDVPFRPSRESLAAGDSPGRRPPREIADRRVVSTREPRVARVPMSDAAGRDTAGTHGAPQREGREARVAPNPRIVQPTADAQRRPAPHRPPFGTRGDGVREAPPPPPRYEDMRRSDVQTGERSRQGGATARPDAPSREARSAPPVPDSGVRERRREAPASDVSSRGEAGRRAQPQRPAESPSNPHVQAGRAQELPGEPANRVYRQRQRAEPPPQRQRVQSAPQGGQMSGSSGSSGGRVADPRAPGSGGGASSGPGRVRQAPSGGVRRGMGREPQR